jgi:hypothetical protein
MEQAGDDNVVGPLLVLSLVLVRLRGHHHHRRRPQQHGGGEHAQPVGAPAPAPRAGAQRPLPALRRGGGARRQHRRQAAAPPDRERGRRRVRAGGGERGGGEGVGGPAGRLPPVHAADDRGEGDRGRRGAPGAAAPVPVPQLAAPPPPHPPRLRRDLGGGLRRARPRAGLPRLLPPLQEEAAPAPGAARCLSLTRLFLDRLIRPRSNLEMAKRAARPGPARARLSPAKNWAGPAESAGLISCPSPTRSGPKRAGPARLVRKKRVEKRAKRAGKHVLV